MFYEPTANKGRNTFNPKHVTFLPSIHRFPLSSEYFVRQSKQTLLVSKVPICFQRSDPSLSHTTQFAFLGLHRFHGYTACHAEVCSCFLFPCLLMPFTINTKLVTWIWGQFGDLIWCLVQICSVPLTAPPVPPACLPLSGIQRISQSLYSLATPFFSAVEDNFQFIKHVSSHFQPVVFSAQIIWSKQMHFFLRQRAPEKGMVSFLGACAVLAPFPNILSGSGQLLFSPGVQILVLLQKGTKF